MDIYRIVHPTIAHTVFSNAYTFTKLDILDHRTMLNKFKGVQVIQSMFSDHN